jgi:hypothetical protein
MAEATVTVPLTNGLRDWWQRRAARNERSLAAEIRFALGEIARRDGGATAGLEPWPPVQETVSRENLADVKARVRNMVTERDALAKREHETGGKSLYPHEQDRLSFLRSQIGSLQSHINEIERLAA